MLPNGTYVTANHCQNKDIFFALRGGGGGTFGVIMEMTTLARPQLTLQWTNITFFGLDEDSQRQVLTVLVENANSWFECGWGGYAIPGATFPVWLMNPVLNAAAANASLQPLLDLATQLGATVQITTYQSFYELYEEHIKNSEVARGGVGFAEASRLIPSKRLEGKVNQAALTKIILDVHFTHQAGDVSPYVATDNAIARDPGQRQRHHAGLAQLNLARYHKHELGLFKDICGPS